MQRNYDFIFKVVLVGPSGVGKTALLRRYADDTFDTNLLPTIGVDFKFKYSKHHADRSISMAISSSCNCGIQPVSSALEPLWSRTIRTQMRLSLSAMCRTRFRCSRLRITGCMRWGGMWRRNARCFCSPIRQMRRGSTWNGMIGSGARGRDWGALKCLRKRGKQCEELSMRLPAY